MAQIGLLAAKPQFVEDLVNNMMNISTHPEGVAFTQAQIDLLRQSAQAQADALEKWLKEMIIMYSAGFVAPNGPVTAPAAGIWEYEIK